MKILQVHTLVLGSGAAGLAAAVRLDSEGVDDVVILTEGLDKGTASYYQRGDSAPRHSPVPEIRVPKRVDSTDGSVHFEEDSDGYSNATIE